MVDYDLYLLLHLVRLDRDQVNNSTKIVNLKNLKNNIFLFDKKKWKASKFIILFIRNLKVFLREQKF